MLIYFKTDNIINNYSLTSCMITDPLSARDGAASRQQTTRERGYKNNKRNFLHSLNLHPLQDLITCCCKNYFPTNLYLTNFQMSHVGSFKSPGLAHFWPVISLSSSCQLPLHLYTSQISELPLIIQYNCPELIERQTWLDWLAEMMAMDQISFDLNFSSSVQLELLHKIHYNKIWLTLKFYIQNCCKVLDCFQILARWW